MGFLTKVSKTKVVSSNMESTDWSKIEYSEEPSPSEDVEEQSVVGTLQWKAVSEVTLGEGGEVSIGVKVEPNQKAEVITDFGTRKERKTIILKNIKVRWVKTRSSEMLYSNNEDFVSTYVRPADVTWSKDETIINFILEPTT